MTTSSNNTTHTASGASSISLGLNLTYLGLILGLATLCLTAAGVGIAAAKLTYGFGGVYHLYSLFDLDGDSSIPTWYASVSLMICSSLLAAHAAVSRRANDGHARAWFGLAVVFLFLSVDETARLHEILGGYIGVHIKAWTGEGDGLLHFSWVLPGMAFVGLMAVVYIRFLLALPRATGMRMIASAAVYVGGALLLEMFNARSEDLYGAHSARYQIGTVFEEFLEMAGVALFAHALTLHLALRTSTIAINVGLPAAPSARRATAAGGSNPIAAAGFSPEDNARGTL